MVNLIELVPPGPTRRVVEHCLADLGLSLADTTQVLYEASKVASAMQTLLDGGGFTPVTLPRESPGEAAQFD